MICVTVFSIRLGGGRPRIGGGELTCGGAICGNWLIGSLRMERAPASMITMAITHEKTGLSMKKRENMVFCLSPY